MECVSLRLCVCVCVVVLCSYVTLWPAEAIGGRLGERCKQVMKRWTAAKKRKLAVLSSLQWLLLKKSPDDENLNLFFSGQPDASFTFANARRHLWHRCEETAGGWFLMTFTHITHINEGCTPGLRSSQLAVHSQGSVLCILKLYSTLISTRELSTSKTVANCG